MTSRNNTIPVRSSLLLQIYIYISASIAQGKLNLFVLDPFPGRFTLGNIKVF